MKNSTLLINPQVDEWSIKDKPFTLELWSKKARRVVKWKNKKFVIRDPWHHYAFSTCNGKTKHFIDGFEFKITDNLTPEQCFKKLGTLKHIDELRLSNIVRPQYV